MAVEQNRTVGLTSNCVLIRRDGFESAIEDSAAPIHDRAGRVMGAVIVFHDGTQGMISESSCGGFEALQVPQPNLFHLEL